MYKQYSLTVVRFGGSFDSETTRTQGLSILSIKSPCGAIAYKNTIFSENFHSYNDYMILHIISKL